MGGYEMLTEASAMQKWDFETAIDRRSDGYQIVGDVARLPAGELQ